MDEERLQIDPLFESAGFPVSLDDAGRKVILLKDRKDGPYEEIGVGTVQIEHPLATPDLIPVKLTGT